MTLAIRHEYVNKSNHRVLNNIIVNELSKNVLFFPQMKPEAKKIELSDSEKVIFDILKTESENL
mgnify:CR=1 FL=1